MIGIVKAYTTRVGSGPFPTELNDEAGEFLRKVGGEYGVTTGRARRTGWFDAVIARYATRVNGVTDFFVTKLDVLSNLDKVPVCVAYEVDGRRYDEIPMTQTEFHHAKPVYEYLDGWWEDISEAKSFEDLPKAARDYVKTIEELSGAPVAAVGVGPRRDQTLLSSARFVGYAAIQASRGTCAYVVDGSGSMAGAVAGGRQRASPRRTLAAERALTTLTENEQPRDVRPGRSAPAAEVGSRRARTCDWVRRAGARCRSGAAADPDVSELHAAPGIRASLRSPVHGSRLRSADVVGWLSSLAWTCRHRAGGAAGGWRGGCAARVGDRGLRAGCGGGADRGVQGVRQGRHGGGRGADRRGARRHHAG